MVQRLRFKCLIIDHDDTAVSSTAEIHYPAHREMMKELRPNLPVPTMETWFLKNFDPGVIEYMVGELNMSETELLREFEIWRSYTSTRIPHFFPGILELLREFRRAGGRVVVVSHSERDLIERDYRARTEGDPFLPDLIFGWDHDETRRKPHPWPAQQTLAAFGLEPREAIILDDLKPGVLMGHASGIPVAAAGWGHSIPTIRAYMEANCKGYFSTIESFASYLM
jgi:phosphoglycolate phosphatase/pyrophosphatase PpaX